MIQILKKCYLSFFIIPIFLFFQNCSSGFESNTNNETAPAFTSNSESGNGGGYNGPNLRFYLIPLIDPSETEKFTDIYDKLFKANISCQFGDYQRGLTGAGSKFRDITSRYDVGPCFVDEKLRNEVTDLLSNPNDQTKMNEASPEAKTCYLWYRNFATNSSQENNLIRTGTLGFAAYDPEIDPPSYKTDPFWQGTNFKWTLTDNNNQQIFHFSTSGGLSYIWIDRPWVKPETNVIERHRVALLNPLVYKPNLDLYDTSTKSKIGATLNQYELLSCIQNEYYFNHTSKTTTASKSLNRITNTNVDCAPLDAWIQSLGQRKGLLNDKANMYNTSQQLDLSSIEASWMNEFNQRKIASQNIFQEYLNGQFTFDQLKSCLSQTHNQADFLTTMQTEFFFLSLQKIRDMNKPYLNRFMDKISMSTSGGVWTVFHVAGISNKATQKAGVHRLHLSAFMNILDIPANEWLFTFVHEMSHRMDEQMLEAAERFSDPKILEGIKAFIAGTTTGTQLTSSQVQAWIQDGFQRGIAAEYRAWLMSARFYEDDLQNHPHNRLEFWENFLEGHRTNDSDFKCFLLKKLATTNFLSDQPEVQNDKLKPFVQTELKKINSCDPYYLQELNP